MVSLPLQAFASRFLMYLQQMLQLLPNSSNSSGDSPPAYAKNSGSGPSRQANSLLIKLCQISYKFERLHTGKIILICVKRIFVAIPFYCSLHLFALVIFSRGKCIHLLSSIDTSQICFCCTLLRAELLPVS